MKLDWTQRASIRQIEFLTNCSDPALQLLSNVNGNQEQFKGRDNVLRFRDIITPILFSSVVGLHAGSSVTTSQAQFEAEYVNHEHTNWSYVLLVFHALIQTGAIQFIGNTDESTLEFEAAELVIKNQKLMSIQEIPTAKRNNICSRT